VKSFPGNTIISFLNDPKIYPHHYPLFIKAQDIIKSMNCASKFAMLPPSSFHMTIKDLLCDQVRVHQDWSNKLAMDARLDEVDRFVIENCADPILSIQRKTLNMKFGFMDPYANSIKVCIIPADEGTKDALKTFRDEISSRTGIKHGNHDDYRFHVTFCYQIRKLIEEEEIELHDTLGQLSKLFESEFGVLTLQPPVLTFFDDMFEFKLKR